MSETYPLANTCQTELWDSKTLGSRFCGKPAVGEWVYEEYRVPMCKHHLEEYPPTDQFWWIPEEPGLRGLRKLGFLLYLEGLRMLYSGYIPPRWGWKPEPPSSTMRGLLCYVQKEEDAR